MMCFCSKKAVANATVLCLFALLAVGMVLSPLSAQIDSSRLPMKSLTVGNRWVYNTTYFYYGSVTYNYNQVIESIIGDTTIENKKYAKVFSTFDNVTRYERSNDTAVYIWNRDNGEQVLETWNLDSVTLKRFNSWTYFAPKSYFGKTQSGGDYMNFFNDVGNKTDSSISIVNNNWSSYYLFSKGYGIDYVRPYGMTKIFENEHYRNPNGSYNKSAELIAWKVNGVSTVSITTSAPNLQTLQGEVLQIPILATGMKVRKFLDSVPLCASLSFNASLLEPIGDTQAGTVTNGIRTVPFAFTLTPNSDTARSVLLFRAAVGNDTATILTPRIEPQAGINYRTTVTNGYVRIWANQAGGEQLRLFSKSPRLRVLALSPNPASDIISLTLSASEKTPVTISLVNTLGQKIRQAEISANAGSQEIPFSVRDVPHGVYMLTLQSHKDILTRQIHILP